MNNVCGYLWKPAAWLLSQGLGHQFLTCMCYGDKSTLINLIDCLLQEQKRVWNVAKALGSITGEKLGRNRKQEIKGENKHSFPNSHTAVVLS